MVEKLYTPEEVAEVLHLKPGTVRKYIREGILSGVRTHPGGGSARRLITETSLQAFIDNCKEAEELKVKKTEEIVSAAREYMHKDTGEKEEEK